MMSARHGETAKFEYKKTARSCGIISMMPVIAYVLYGVEDPMMLTLGMITAVFGTMWIVFDTPPLLERQVLRMPVVYAFFAMIMAAGMR